MFKVIQSFWMCVYFCSCMLFTVYICGCHSLLSVNISPHEGSFGNLLRGAQAVVGIARCAHTSLHQCWRNKCTWGLFLCCMKVDVNSVYVTVLIVWLCACGCLSLQMCFGEEGAGKGKSICGGITVTTGSCTPLLRPLPTLLHLPWLFILPWLWGCQSG